MIRALRAVGAIVLGYVGFAGGLSALVLAVWDAGRVQPTGIGLLPIVLALVALGLVVGVVTGAMGGELGRVAAYIVGALVLAVTIINILLDVAIEPLWFKLCVIGLVIPAIVVAGRRAAGRRGADTA